MPLPYDLLTSRFGAVVTRLYYFYTSDGREWMLSSGNRVIPNYGLAPNPGDFIPCAGLDMDEPQDITIDKAAINIYLPTDHEITLLFRDSPPSCLVRVKVWEKVGDIYRYVWLGRITNVMHEKNRCSMNVSSSFSSLKRPGLRRKWTSRCQWALYSTNCGVNKASYANVTTVTAITGTTNGYQITVAETLDENVFADGEATWTNSVTGKPESRGVRNNGANDVLVSGTLPGLSVGDEVTFYRGCNKSFGAGGCADFDNKEFFGGCPWQPDDSPFNPRKNLFW